MKKNMIDGKIDIGIYGKKIYGFHADWKTFQRLASLCLCPLSDTDLELLFDSGMRCLGSQFVNISTWQIEGLK